MGLARYVVDAVVLEGRSPTEIARLHGISRSWLYRLLGRYREGGYAALAPRSRRPHSCSHQTSPELEVAIVAVRAELVDAGHDAGPATIAHHLGRRFDAVPSQATVWRNDFRPFSFQTSAKSTLITHRVAIEESSFCEWSSARLKKLPS